MLGGLVWSIRHFLRNSRRVQERPMLSLCPRAAKTQYATYLCDQFHAVWWGGFA